VVRRAIARILTGERYMKEVLDQRYLMKKNSPEKKDSARR